MNHLTVEDSMTTINNAIHELNKVVGSSLSHWHTSTGKYGYSSEIRDTDIRDEYYQAYNHYPATDVYTMYIDFPLEYFSDMHLALDDEWEVQPSASLENKARQRCMEHIKHNWELFKKKTKIIGKNYLQATVYSAVDHINHARKLRLSVETTKYDYGTLTAYITEPNIAPKSLQILIDEAYFDDLNNDALDGLIGPQHIKHDDWRRNGLLRISFLIFKTFQSYLQNHNPEAYQKLFK